MHRRAARGRAGFLSLPLAAGINAHCRWRRINARLQLLGAQRQVRLSGDAVDFAKDHRLSVLYRPYGDLQAWIT
jgi:hypothetical protein